MGFLLRLRSPRERTPVVQVVGAEPAVDARLTLRQLQELAGELPKPLLRALIAGSRPAIRFAVRPLAEGEAAAVGVSRFGGRPDLPPEVTWPSRTDPADGGERALSFLAQVSLAGLVGGTDLPLPREGLLLFFCDTSADPANGVFDLSGNGVHQPCRLLHVPADGLRRRPTPEQVLEFAPAILGPVFVTTIPEPAELDDVDGPERTAYDRFSDAVERRVRSVAGAGWAIAGRHQLGGHAREPLGQVLLRVDGDESLGVGWGHGSARFRASRSDDLGEVDWSQAWVTHVAAVPDLR